MIVGGIVTYNPILERLNKNIDAALKQVKYLIIIDNYSQNRNEILNCVKRYREKRIVLIYNLENVGLAKALNQIFIKSIELKADWTLTLDQDSIIPALYCNYAQQFFSNKKIGIICPLVYDTNIEKVLSKKNKNEVQYINKCITSASIVRNNVWELIGKFDEKFFIDYVDFDFCMRVQEKGFKIIQLNKIYIEHELGSSIIQKVGPFSLRVSNHNNYRRYYMVRNIILYIRKYKKNIFVEILRIVKIYIFVIFFEEDKKNKLTSMNKGMVDGFCLKLEMEK